MFFIKRSKRAVSYSHSKIDFNVKYDLIPRFNLSINNSFSYIALSWLSHTVSRISILENHIIA